MKDHNALKNYAVGLAVNPHGIASHEINYVVNGFKLEVYKKINFVFPLFRVPSSNTG